MHSLLSVTLLLSHLILPTSTLTECAKKSECACYSKGGDIDLSPLKQTPPRSIPGHSPGETFYWQPCGNFDMGDQTNVGCVQERDGKYFPIGTNTDSTTFAGINGDGDVQFKMVAADNIREMTIACHCDWNLDFQIVYKGETPPSDPIGPITYGFDMASKYCCQTYSPIPPPTGGPVAPGGPGAGAGASIGTIVIIVFFAIVIVYVGAGIAYNTTIRQASGREVMPNVGFWGDLPGLIWDGFKFTLCCGKGSYQPISNYTTFSSRVGN